MKKNYGPKRDAAARRHRRVSGTLQHANLSGATSNGKTHLRSVDRPTARSTGTPHEQRPILTAARNLRPPAKCGCINPK
ncbi:hypothetical protein J6590_029338 [Homalodisca vitripennis]|nr:hypothetical protein J6590_029338 [Homalodisca vitripennis]